jgi:hypothetical protein
MLRNYRFNWDFSSTAEAATGLLLLATLIVALVA